ncbi:galactosyldiacylglycerol synthase [Lampropedia cohaerens]|uniref:Galactosyldiacylglycerol synthase n=1 Tax=Lampropedia cohaerens TaxID=1610491 RepID=A0A0U1Q025_9BURK|nr:glycosyltransferase [Lampropedia cohaerens]KKW68086.1 galactosyldiacylglycerol synthase [Lampropedia cohaerens]
MTPSLELIYINAGGGHRASAQALQAIAQQQGRNWDVRLVNLFERIDPGQRFYALTGLNPEDLYNKRLARGWTRGMAQELYVLQQLIRLGHRRLLQRLLPHWQASRPDMVVSLVPNFNRVMFESLRASGSAAPYVTVMTDFADLPRGRFWIERDLPIHLVCGTRKAVEQARAMGHPPALLHEVSGMLVRPEFYAPPKQSREQAMRRHGLTPGRPTALVLFGGHGGRHMLQIARRLGDMQAIYLCGHNQALAERLQALPAQAPRLIQGFTSDVPAFMHMADFMIGKPGPGSISEAVRCGLPVVLLHSGATMPQERYNVEWVREMGVGIACTTYLEIARAAHAMQADLPAWQQRVRAIDNRALFEVPEILETILATAGRRHAVRDDRARSPAVQSALS